MQEEKKALSCYNSNANISSGVRISLRNIKSFCGAARFCFFCFFILNNIIPAQVSLDES